MKYLFLSIFLLLHLSINSQTLKGVIFDSVSGEKLQYANLSFKDKKIGTFCNEKGDYNIDLSQVSNKDTLIVSLIGYQNKNIALVNYLQNKAHILDVHLIPKIEILNEVIVLNKKDKFEHKEYKLKTGNRKTIFPSSVPFGYETAAYIENRKNQKGKL